MHQFYDYCPEDQSTIEARLRVPQTLSRAGIPCLIHGEDALSFIHFVPTLLFALNIVVSNDNLECAKAEIMKAHPYRIFTGISDSFHEPLWTDPARTRTFPNSVFLERVAGGTEAGAPNLIIVHPETDFNLAVTDYSRSVSLPPFPDNIRFPTKAAFLDSTIEVYLDPNWGLLSSVISNRHTVWIEYVIDYCIRPVSKVLPNGDLVPEAEELLRSLKPENQPLFCDYIRGGIRAIHPEQHRLNRRQILENLGKPELSERPLPRRPPGNPNWLATLREQQAYSQSPYKALERAAIGGGQSST